jgi:hypothetical protein
VGLLEVAAWWELVVFVYSKLKRSKKKKTPKPQGAQRSGRG